MILAMRQKLKLAKTQKTMIAWPTGASPLIIAFILMGITINSALESHNLGWVNYLVHNQKHIFQSLMVSSLLVAVFSTLLRNKIKTFMAAFQPVLIQVASIIAVANQDTALRLVLSAITILPLLILLVTLTNEIGPPNGPKEGADD